MFYKLSAVAAFALLAATAHAEGDAAKGKIVFKKCAVCHNIDGANKVGPPLANVVGRPVATVEGFKYSKAMTAYGADGKVWDEATLAAYLEAPTKVVKGTTMAFAGLKKPEDQADLIAYLKNPATAP